jgi:hypothetical protein
MTVPVRDAHPEMTRLVCTLGALALAYGILSGHRWDYLAHFVMGAGLALLAVVVGWELGWPHHVAGILGLTMVLIGSVVIEYLFFSALMVDWADVGSGVLGAGVVAAVAIRARPGSLAAGVAGPLTAFLLLGGLVLRYGFDEGWGLA